jgi:putative FmdB family regulatory protein
MPTYEYACKSCGEHLEVVQSFKDEPLTECPNCGGNLRKVFGSIGIAFKGSGFYKTDSRSGSKSGKHKEPVKSSTDTSSSDKSSSDTSSTEKKSSGESKSSDSKPSESKASESKAAS